MTRRLQTRASGVTEPPQLTVAVPTYNGANHLAETLRSILFQEDVRFELLISDDGSDDSTLNIVRLEAGDRAKVVVNSDRLGLAGNWNQCVSLSSTPLVAIVHQDDVLLSGHLSSHGGAFANDATTGLVASASTVIDREGREVPESVVGRGSLGTVDLLFAPGEAIPAMAAGNPLRCSAVTIRKEAHAQAGGFDPALRYVVDWDLWLRIARVWSVAWLARESIAVRWHEESETHRFYKGTADLEETERVIQKVFTGFEPGSVGLAALQQSTYASLGRAYLNRAHVALRGGDGELSRRCLSRALSLSPRLVWTILADTRLAAQMVSVATAPTMAARWFGRTEKS